MKAKEEAKKLVSKYYALIDFSEVYQRSSKSAKQCALICVDEILAELKKIGILIDSDVKYWQEVKQEIEKL